MKLLISKPAKRLEREGYIMNNNIPLLSEMLRPHCLSELNVEQGIINSLQNMASKGSILNLLFYGQPGIGKTSAARILFKEMGAEVYEINGSFNNGDKTMVKAIESFAWSMSLLNGPKICFIDEADFMSKEAQASLRYLIERVSSNTRFLLTANDINRLSPALRSRCHPICFDVRPADTRSVVNKMTERYIDKLKALNINADPDRLAEIVGIYFPDLRSIANQFQMEFAN